MYEGYQARERNFYFEIDEKLIGHFDSYLRRCREYCRTDSTRLRLLDIGCGNGSFLSRAKKQGFVCEGIETCEPLAEEVRKTIECPVHTTLLSECEFAPATFDVVTMYDLIEHLQDPVADLRLIRGWLKPGGVLFLLTPNDNALLRRISRLAFRSSFHVVERPMRSLYYSHHLSYFTPASLRVVLESTGLETILMETRNQELSRLNLSRSERLAVSLVFGIAGHFSWSGGKLLAWARR
jgi:2-polyprenyl-3-methyl-5-hydroxy-6-metoxy-1,4-benzoquinol methylase